MKIASLVIRVRPEQIDALAASLPKIPGVEVHGANAALGRLIVTVEDGGDYSLADSLLAVSVSDHVLGVTLAYEYTDEGLQIDCEYPEPLPGPLYAGLQVAAAGVKDKEAVK